ncbi:MAG: SDR family NAD(P)-dependent oxidoreductase [Flavobacteriaceae bacterium]|nr:SDR family oxidoreductase [Flavobacteriaceae bacterium]MDG1973907.1 SDR family NAD(P)-dependent oxidoreductase [Flavobacteriaceae bacterium]MDG2368396.1 SDR family NAD(P)-dependent oxidoreductase [Flavobacteriaceae bacterium]|tara:strand:- start:523 stop:1224 length:702 start_codon:yes stop_codon:yes gene_type:complete
MKKNILFIGGSTGIGLETIKLLHEKCNLIVASRTNENLENLDVKHLKFDVLNDELDLNEIPEILDGFVYCPGSINLRPFRGLKINTFQDDLNINFLSMVKILQQVLNNLKKSECSSIVLYSTVAVKIGMPFHSSISASKGAIEGFAKSLAAEFAPDIRVNVIAPSLTDTPLASRFLNNDLKKEKVGHRHPLKRHGNAIDIANSTAFLLSEESSWLTGQILGVDGGMSTLNTSN